MKIEELFIPFPSDTALKSAVSVIICGINENVFDDLKHIKLDRKRNQKITRPALEPIVSLLFYTYVNDEEKKGEVSINHFYTSNDTEYSKALSYLYKMIKNNKNHYDKCYLEVLAAVKSGKLDTLIKKIYDYFNDSKRIPAGYIK